MWLTCGRNELAEALNVAAKVMTDKYLPALASFHLSAGASQLVVKGGGLDICITTAVEADVKREGTVLAPRVLSSLVASAPDDEVSLEVVDGQLIVSSGQMRVELTTADPEQYPSIELAGEFASYSITDHDLAKMVKVASVADANAPAVVFGGVLWEEAEGNVVLVATDMYRLAKAETGFAGGKEIRAVIPAVAIKQIAKASQPVVAKIAPSVSQFEIGPRTIVCRNLAGQFPAWQQVMPKEGQGAAVTIAPEDLLQSLRRAVAIVNAETNKARANIVSLSYTDEGLLVEGRASEVGEFREVVEAVCDNELAVMVNIKYLIDCLEMYRGQDEITLWVGDMLWVEQDGLFHMLMPLRQVG